MAIKTWGINHPALLARNLEETVSFYSDLLGMRLVLRQPNLDDPNSTHLFFDTGNGNFLAFFAPNEGTQDIPRPGSMLHVALNLTVPIEEAMETLTAHGVRFAGPIDRGYERSLYFRDPNGIVIELMTWKTPLPEGADEGEVIVKAQEIRLAEGAYAIEDEHVAKALQQLDTTR